VSLALARQDQSGVDSAKALFDRYVKLEQAFDARLADLYADDAVITNKRTYPNGEVRELTFPAPKYKALIRQAMPLAKARGDRNTYSRCEYQALSDRRVQITCSRYSELKQYTSPLMLVVGLTRGGAWVIQEERSESRP
jgi:hypothetical protein